MYCFDKCVGNFRANIGKRNGFSKDFSKPYLLKIKRLDEPHGKGGQQDFKAIKTGDFFSKKMD